MEQFSVGLAMLSTGLSSTQIHFQVWYKISLFEASHVVARFMINKGNFQLHNNHVGLQRKFQVFVPRGF